MKLQVNPLLNVDSYKFDHINQNPKDTDFIHSSIIARKPSKFIDHVVVAYKPVLVDYLTVQLTREMVDEAEEEAKGQGYDFNRTPWDYIVKKHNGYLPLKIKAVPEGTVVPCGTVIVSVVNTDPKCQCASVSSYVETVLQRGVWKPTTVASVCRGIYDVLLDAARETGADESYPLYALHNFGDRGADCTEAAIICGVSQAFVFNGSDCSQANRYIKFYYNTKKNYTSSVIASEHSSMAANADSVRKNDFDAAVMMLDRLDETLLKIENGATHLIPIVSIVADLYDPFRFTRDFIGTQLRSRVLELGARGGKVVIRPDSGNPLTIPIEILDILAECFGYTINDKGFKVLPPYVGVIQGDGINQDSVRELIQNVKNAGYCISNIVFGMGGGLTHGASRDEFSFAQKATSRITSNGTEHDLFKDPITDSGKRSLTGIVTTYYAKDSDRIFSDRTSLMDVNKNIQEIMVTVFENGKLYNEISFDEVRANAKGPYKNK